MSRMSRFPDFPNALSGSSMQAWWVAVKAAVVGGQVSDFATTTAALASMKTDGGAPSRVYTLTDDPAAIYVTDRLLTSGVRIGPGDTIAIGLAKFHFKGSSDVSETTPEWSAEISIPLGDSLGGRSPDGVWLQSMAQGGGTQTVTTFIMTDGGAESPDVNASRIRARCRMSPAPSSPADRYTFWLAIALES